GEAILVETTEDLRLDLDDLAAKAETSGARTLLLSHMRGHLCDMDRLMEITGEFGIITIEDCAHTMGATWRGTRSGNFGLAGCFSTQTYKHMNSGEGGLLLSDDPQFAARAIILSGSYMLYERHGAAPGPEHFDDARLDMPNTSARMDHLRAAILRPQIASLEGNVARWNARYKAVASELARCQAIHLPHRPREEGMVGSSIQFRVPGLSPAGCRDVISRAADRGVEIKWFGAEAPAGFTSAHGSWRYMPRQEMPRSDRVLADLFDMRLPLTFSVDDCTLIGRILADVAGAETKAPV
ncbi:MAG: DegT/DnrJ/EryC1/StrS family aminotransferase, partial [Pseudomonadota bacterium]